MNKSIIILILFIVTTQSLLPHLGKEIPPSIQKPSKDNQQTQSLFCQYSDLSDEFDMELNFFSIKFQDVDSSFINLIIKNKATETIMDTIVFTSIYIMSPVFSSCKCVRSYSTGKNLDLPVFENQFGNIVVADLNFDGKDDIAIAKDFGGNGGIIYNFYFQNDKGKFVFDSFFTNTILRFPLEIDNINKTLLIRVPANTYQYHYTIIQIDSNKNWKIINQYIE